MAIQINTHKHNDANKHIHLFYHEFTAITHVIKKNNDGMYFTKMCRIYLILKKHTSTQKYLLTLHYLTQCL
jgi:hypothetical protein